MNSAWRLLDVVLKTLAVLIQLSALVFVVVVVIAVVRTAKVMA